VPYFSWKYTHAAHHKNTNSCEHDEVFVPATRAETPPINDTPLAHFIGLVVMLSVGWCVATPAAWPPLPRPALSLSLALLPASLPPSLPPFPL